MVLQWLWSMFWGAADEEDSPEKDAEDDWVLLSADGEDAELWLILVGKSGGGKSATGNTILGRKAFKSIVSAKTTTLKCQMGRETWQGTMVSVVDTPAIFDSEDCDATVCEDVRACVELSQPGPHTLIFVTQVGRFTAEDAAAAKRVWDVFGGESVGRTVVLFTCAEDLDGGSLKEYVRLSDNGYLRDVIGRCGNRFCGFNNKAAGDERERQVSELMKKVRRTVSKNGGSYYINQLYREPNLEDEDIRRLIEQNQEGDKYFVRVVVEKVISAGRSFFSFLNNSWNAVGGRPQLTAGASVVAHLCPAQLVTDPEDRETGDRSVDLAPASDSKEVGEDAVSEAESQPGPTAPPEVPTSDSGEEEALEYVVLPEGRSG